MSIQFNLIQLIVGSAVINGLIYSLLVLFKKENRVANYFLCLLLISLSLTFTPYIIEGKYFNKFLWLSWVPLSLAYWIGPSLYFYIQHLTKPHYQFKQKQLWHFVPIVLNYFHSIYHALSDGSNPFPYFHVFAEFLEICALISVFIYCWLSYKELSSYNQSILDQLSNIEHVHLKWLRNFIKILAILFFVVSIYFLLTNQIVNKTYPESIKLYRNGTLLLYALAMYWLTIGGYRQSQTINTPINLQPVPKSVKSDKLIAIMKEQQLYLDPELSLNSLSRSTGFSEREISTILNQDLQKNFYQFVNEFRVEDVKVKLIDPANQHLKIVSLAYESGFNSKATFNRIFKNQVGKSPQEFKESG